MRVLSDAEEWHGGVWATNETFDDGEALYAAVCEQGLEGIVVKTRTGRDVPGGRSWMKRKNPTHWRQDAKLEAIARKHERRTRINT